MLQMHLYQGFITGPRSRDSIPHPGPGGTPGVDTVPTPFAYAADPCPTALARCGHAARSIVRIVQGLVSHVRSPTKAWAELRDIPAIITGTCVTCTILHTVSVAEGHVQPIPTTFSGRPSDIALTSGKGGDGNVGAIPGDLTTNEEFFDVCIETLKLLQER
jgi:hypothetical protein